MTDHTTTDNASVGTSANQRNSTHSVPRNQKLAEKALESAVRLVESILQPKVLIFLMVPALIAMKEVQSFKVGQDYIEVNKYTSWAVRNITIKLDKNLEKGEAKVCQKSSGIEMFGKVLWLRNPIGDNDNAAGPIHPIVRIGCFGEDNIVYVGPKDAETLKLDKVSTASKNSNEVLISSIPPGYELDQKDMSLRRTEI